MTADEFRAALKRIGMTQRELAAAEHLGVNHRTVSLWATGVLPVPRYAEYALELLERSAWR
jgi:transcriptional regulator with XRE-family HTH domain